MSVAFQTVVFCKSSTLLRPALRPATNRRIRAATTMTPTSSLDVAPYPPRRIIADNVFESMVDAIGNTPLIKLQRASRETGCNIYGKAEFMNPGGSVKARAALYLIKDAEDRGLLTPGQPGTILESTAGNTGISLAEIACSRGYTCIVVMPQTQSQEKKDALLYAGAQLVLVPAKPYSNPNNFVRHGARLAKQLGAVYMNQFDNLANRQAHVETTGPEIWAQLKGKVHGFSCAVGSGGTLAGTAEYLRSASSDVKIALTDPCGANMVNFFNEGVLRSEGESITEGIGQARITANIEGFRPDYAWEVTDREGMEVLYNIMKEEGLCLGSSSGINIAGAMRLARELGPGHNIVTVLCDLGTRYTAKMFNLEFLEKKGLPGPEWIAHGLSEEVEAAVQSTKVPDDVATAEQAAAVEQAAEKQAAAALKK